MKANKLIYFCSEIDSVFDSQVLELLKSIIDRQIFKKVYLLFGVRNKSQKLELQNKVIPSNLTVILYRSTPNYPFFNILLRREILNVLKKHNLLLEDAIYHTRHEILAWHLYKVIKKEHQNNILPDIRGASIEEVKEFSEINLLLKYFKIYNFKKALNNLRNFNRIITVSESLKSYLVRNFKINPDNISIVPCLTGTNFRYDIEERNKIRTALNIKPTDLILLYSSGSISNWHNSSIIKILADKGARVLNLSKTIIQHKNVLNKFIGYHEMSSYLNAADISIIWRDTSIVNAVASPVKFGEYLCCGLPVISNYSIDSIVYYINRNSSGYLFTDESQIDVLKIAELRLLNRHEISAKGIEDFGIKNITQKYFEIYSSFIKIK